MSVLIVWPFAGYYLTGYLEPILPTFIPFVDETSTLGYVILFIFEGLICVLGMSGTCGADFMLFILIVHMWPMCQIFDNMFKELNQGLLVEEHRNSSQIRGHFRNILMVHQDMCWLVIDTYRKPSIFVNPFLIFQVSRRNFEYILLYDFLRSIYMRSVFMLQFVLPDSGKTNKCNIHYFKQIIQSFAVYMVSTLLFVVINVF